MEVPGPVYVRVGKGNNPTVPGLNGKFEWDIPTLARPGKDILFVATGSIAFETVRAAEQLAQLGVSAAVAVLAHLAPVGSAALVQLLRTFPGVVAVEEGIGTGGLGSLITQTIACHQVPCHYEQVAVTEPFVGVCGQASYLQMRAGLSVEHLVWAGLRAAAPGRRVAA